MAREIEEKYLVAGDGWRSPAGGVHCRQGYLSLDPERIVRVRILGDRGFLAVKGMAAGAVRPEFEYEIPREDARELLGLCRKPLVEKIRHAVPYGGREWVVDVFLGENQGLVVAEVELSREGEPFAKPPWAGRRVTDDPRYANANLVRRPFTAWER